MRAVRARRGGGLHVGGVGAGLLLGQRKGGELLPAHQRRQPFFLLLARAENKSARIPIE